MIDKIKLIEDEMKKEEGLNIGGFVRLSVLIREEKRQAFKVKCAEHGETMSDVILEAIDAFLE